MPHTEQLPDLAAMAAFGGRIARLMRSGDVVALSGGLGAGKTTLARAVIETLGHEGEVPSPTFTILETYPAPPLSLAVVHADFYRLQSAHDLEELGLDEYWEDAALLAEWPEMVGGFAHEASCLSIRLETAEEGRMAIVTPGKDWQERWQ